MKNPMNPDDQTPDEPSRAEAATSGAPFPFPTHDDHAPLPGSQTQAVTEEPTEDALDHGIEESFPASDPVSVSVTKVVPKPAPPEAPEDGAKPAA